MQSFSDFVGTNPDSQELAAYEKALNQIAPLNFYNPTAELTECMATLKDFPTLQLRIWDSLHKKCAAQIIGNYSMGGGPVAFYPSALTELKQYSAVIERGVADGVATLLQANVGYQFVFGLPRLLDHNPQLMREHVLTILHKATDSFSGEELGRTLRDSYRGNLLGDFTLLHNLYSADPTIKQKILVAATGTYERMLAYSQRNFGAHKEKISDAYAGLIQLSATHMEDVETSDVNLKFLDNPLGGKLLYVPQWKCIINKNGEKADAAHFVDHHVRQFGIKPAGRAYLKLADDMANTSQEVAGTVPRPSLPTYFEALKAKLEATPS